MSAFADGLARVAGRVAVIGEHAEGVIQARGKVVKFGELILRQSLGGKKIEGARVRIFENGVENRQVVAKRLAGSGGSDHHEIFSGAGQLRQRQLDANKGARSLWRDRQRPVQDAPKPAWGRIAPGELGCALWR